MSKLHTVNKSPFEKSSLESCLAHVSEGAAVLLFEDGIYGALKGTAAAETVERALTSVKVYVLGEDLKARGFDEDRLINGISVVDYGGFVDLAAQADAVQAWL
ncbi:sulfurtransferase complex subunit TusB [Thiorhodovibrio frisius]|uniref:Sulfur relay protein TusB/DsrH n=1 Tax=Thiorhodovibrio frisius TaxID=631362 RepID=H8Z023_9GAMM|nr:sulfurtransferase complex subunit TusB [Thiorhodovibrio frisius]EIC21196.1 sulfur relay protein TusB/DsrH [Thiorhodovibrio frisius]WPL23772.1 tRNA 2-thiouridine synthesizing protein B [Thiorhodovibrio frisius]